MGIIVQNTHIQRVELQSEFSFGFTTISPESPSAKILPGTGLAVAMSKPKRLVSENGAAGDQTLKNTLEMQRLHLPPPKPAQVLLLTAYNTTLLSMHAPLNKMCSGPGQRVSGELPGISGECLRVR